MHKKESIVLVEQQGEPWCLTWEITNLLDKLQWALSSNKCSVNAHQSMHIISELTGLNSKTKLCGSSDQFDRM